MNRRKFLWLNIIIFTLISMVFIGCEGSSSNSSKEYTVGNGTYIDSAVSGVSYICGKEKGVTDEDGRFTFEVGASCTFFIKDIKLREVAKNALFDKVIIFENKPKVAQFLQTLDTDGDPSNGITIDPRIIDLLDGRLPENEEELEALVEKILKIAQEDKSIKYRGHVVSEEDAKKHIEVTRRELDTTPPVITLLGSTPMSVNQDETFIDPSITATDDYYDTNEISISTSGTVDTTTPNAYTITYTATDGASNSATTTRVVNVVDVTKPVITLTGNASISLPINGSYTEQGATCNDNYDTSCSVTLGGDTVDTSTAGSYTVTYNTVDASGNNADEIIRTISIELVGQIWYIDADEDGYGDHDNSTFSNSSPRGYVLNDTDCDDSNNFIHPGATEHDCTDPTDYNCDGSAGNVDNDKDGFLACEDCNDMNSSIHPSADELCNGIDDDCDGNIDEDAINMPRWYADFDQDNYGNPNITIESCSMPSGYVSNHTDCDDLNSNIYPGAEASENNCDLISIIAPNITLIGNASISLLLNEDYTEQDATCHDNYDETCSVIIGGDSVNTSTVGTYNVTYNAIDSNGNHATEVKRTVFVVLGDSPDIQINGESPYVLERGTTYHDAGATATDTEDTTVLVTSNITSILSQLSEVGEYTLTYRATDSQGNVATATRIIQVIDSGLDNIAKNNSLHNINVTFESFTIVVYTDALVETTSNSTKAIYGNINGNPTNALIQVNSNYPTGTAFIVKVFSDGTLVGKSQKLILTDASLNFNNISTE